MSQLLEHMHPSMIMEEVEDPEMSYEQVACATSPVLNAHSVFLICNNNNREGFHKRFCF